MMKLCFQLIRDLENSQQVKVSLLLLLFGVTTKICSIRWMGQIIHLDKRYFQISLIQIFERSIDI
ncbi:unnamed protein product [Paramecium pentaurelia]|uniref:Uncharacterized protein n=1 Tax=Paramecium pentaurelia TaxID=43138 RepID=A0A8S1V084_9CILI|nr:unnamed protein product [Paramecium pentaurelia]CAD8169937.1 unnamed protein product [Paramecium pentaurelia]